MLFHDTVVSLVKAFNPNASDADADLAADRIATVFVVTLILFVFLHFRITSSSDAHLSYVQSQLEKERRGRAVAMGIQRAQMEAQRRRSCAASKGAGTKSVLRGFGFYDSDAPAATIVY